MSKLTFGATNGDSSIVISAVSQVFLIGRSFVFSQAIDGPHKQTRRMVYALLKTLVALLAFSAGCGMQWEFNVSRQTFA